MRGFRPADEAELARLAPHCRILHRNDTGSGILAGRRPMDADEARAFVQQPATLRESRRVRRKRQPGEYRTKTEARFAAWVGAYRCLAYEPFSLILGNGGKPDQVLYTPDFVCPCVGGSLFPAYLLGCRLSPAVAHAVTATGGESLRLDIYEVKPAREVERKTSRGRDSIAKLKIASELFPFWRFYLARWDGQWDIRRVGGVE